MIKPKEAEKASPHELEEQPDRNAWQTKRDKIKPLIKFVQGNEGEASIELTVPPKSSADEWTTRLQEIYRSTGAIDQDFGLKLMLQYVNCTVAFSDHTKNIDEINSYLTTMNALEPADEIEGMLCTQILSLGDTAMKYLSSMNRSGSLERSEKYCNMATKLLRLHSEKIEALARYRRKGTQQVIVQHVNVESGGQAVVGAVNQRGGDRKNQGGTS